MRNPWLNHSPEPSSVKAMKSANLSTSQAGVASLHRRYAKARHE